MKKKSLKSLKLNKKTISNIFGGEMLDDTVNSNFASCIPETELNCETITCYSLCYHTCGPGHCID